MKRKELILVTLLALVNFTHILDFMILMPLGNILMPKWHLNSSQFSLIVSSYSLAAFISSFIAIFFADRFDRKKILLIAYVGFLIGTFSCVFAFDNNSMILVRTITGVFGGLISAQVLSVISDVIPYKRRGKAMGLLMGGFALASVVGVPFGLYIATMFKWYAPFLIVAGFGTLLIPFLLKFIPNVNNHLESKAKFKDTIQNFINIFSDRMQITALLFSFVLIVGHFIIIPLISPYLVYNVGVSENEIPFIYLFGGVSSLITAQIVGELADKYGKRQVFVIAAIVSMVLVFIVTNMPRISVFWVVLLFSLWFSSITGRSVPGQAMTTETVSLETRGSFMNLNSCIQSLGIGLGGLISSWITYSDEKFSIHNYDYLGYISNAMIMICILLVFILDKLFVENKITASIN